MSADGYKKRAFLLKPKSGKLLFGLCLALLGKGSFALAGSFSGNSYEILRGVFNFGGDDKPVSSNYNLAAEAGELGRSSYTSAGYILQPGFANLMVWPERVTDFAAVPGA